MGLSFLQLGLGWYFWIVSRSLLFTDDICYWILCWARAPGILFVVQHKHWEGKSPLPPIERSTCLATHWGLSSQAVHTVWKQLADSWWQPILFWCLEKWDFPRTSLSPVTGRVHRVRFVMSAVELWPYSNEMLISHCTAYTNSSKVPFTYMRMVWLRRWNSSITILDIYCFVFFFYYFQVNFFIDSLVRHEHKTKDDDQRKFYISICDTIERLQNVSVIMRDGLRYQGFKMPIKDDHVRD